MTASIKTIFHKTTGASFSTENKSNSEIIAEIKKAGHTLGAKNLAAMLKGEKAEAGDFTTVQPEAPKETATAQAAGEATGSAAPAADASNPAPAPAAAKAPRAKMPTLRERVLAAGALATIAMDPAKLEALTPEQRAIAEKEINDQREALAKADKFSFRGTDWSKVLPQSPVAVRKDSKIHKLLTFLCTPGGVTKEDILKEFGWTPGGLAGIIHWEPKAKGYFLQSEKGADGKMRYSLKYHATHNGGGFVKAEDIPVQEAKVKAAPAPKAPKAAAPAQAPEGGQPSVGQVTSRKRAAAPAQDSAEQKQA